MPISEMAFGDEAEKRFRPRYVELFGAATRRRSALRGRQRRPAYQGMEHWLPLFHDSSRRCSTICRMRRVSFDHAGRRSGRAAARADRRPLRCARAGAGAQSVRRAALQARAAGQHVPRRARTGPQRWPAASCALDPFEHPSAARGYVRSFGGRQGRTFAAERADRQASTCSTPSVGAYAQALQAQSKRVIVAAGRKARASGWPRFWPITARRHREGRELRRGRSRCRADADRLRRAAARDRASRRRSSPSSASRTFSATGWCAAAQARKRAADVLTEATSLSRRRSRRPCRPRHRPLRGLRPSRRWARRTTASRCTTPAATSSICRSRTSSC